MTFVRTVLVVDDEPSLRALVRTILEREGHRVLEAASAAELFECLDLERPDVILLDVHLGPEDGLAIGAGLRAEKRHRDVEIIFMSGTLDAPELLRQSKLFKARILRKPFDLEELTTAVAA
jgi:DNA-binding response OmpR family regulator